jgi:prepilin-type N-terminal cleavage/methylation domain-containing protein
MKKFLEKIKERLSNESGFTMIELIIVIALIAIIGAMLVPSFAETTARSRIKTDINGLTTIQNAVDLYEAETGKKITSIAAGSRINTLTTMGYLKSGVKAQQSGGTYEIEISTAAAGTADSGQSVATYSLDSTVANKYLVYAAGIENMADLSNADLSVKSTTTTLKIRKKAN